MTAIATSKYFNVGHIDAAARVLVAIVAMAAVLTANLNPVWTFVLSAFSVPTVLFAVMRWDPVYGLFGLRTTTDKLVA